MSYSDLSDEENFSQIVSVRAKVLGQDRDNVQANTFTQWMNSYLSTVGMEITNIFEDLRDGKRLIKLLELLTGEEMPKPNRGRMRIHKIENVDRALNFLRSFVHLESIGAEDIVDGNKRLTLGVIWTIILRFQILNAEQTLNENDNYQSNERKTAKDLLLAWCKRETIEYPGVSINNFTTSWRDGLAFNALIHSQNPSLFDFNELDPYDNISNLNYAFETAYKHFGISKLLNADDIDINRPDEKSILTYISTLYRVFSNRIRNTTELGNADSTRLAVAAGPITLERRSAQNVTMSMQQISHTDENEQDDDDDDDLHNTAFMVSENYQSRPESPIPQPPFVNNEDDGEKNEAASNKDVFPTYYLTFSDLKYILNKQIPDDRIFNNIKLKELYSMLPKDSFEHTEKDFDEYTLNEIRDMLEISDIDDIYMLDLVELKDRLGNNIKKIKDTVENTNNEDEKICKICMDAIIECVFVECGHMISCLKCSKSLTTCPFCRQVIIKAIKVYK